MSVNEVPVMLSRRECLKAAFCATCLVSAGSVLAALPESGWSAEAFSAANPSLEAVKRHAFLQGVFQGTLAKEKFAAYLCQNIGYLDNYARCLDYLAVRLSRSRGFEKEVQALKQWAQETRDMRVWTIDYAGSLNGQKIDSLKIVPLPELLAYQDFETRCVRDAEPSIAMAALLPCFWVWNEFGKALRSGAVIEGNPFRDWVEGMGSEAADVSARKATALADRLAAAASDDVRKRMTDVFAAGCWLEWQLFDAVSHG